MITSNSIDLASQLILISIAKANSNLYKYGSIINLLGVHVLCYEGCRTKLLQGLIAAVVSTETTIFTRGTNGLDFSMSWLLE